MSNLVKKNDYNTNISESKTENYWSLSWLIYFYSGFNKFTAENFAARLEQGNLTSKNNISALVKKQILMRN